MTTHHLPGLFVTGTDTGVGKTYVAAMIARALAAEGRRVGVYKPAASGCSRDAHGNLTSDDAVQLWEAAGKPGDLEHVCPQRFAAPLAPHLAARAEGRELDFDQLRWGLDYWRPRSDVVVVEGAGGLFSPLGDHQLNIDLALPFGFALVVVTANRLGAIHATLATVIACKTTYPEIAIAGAIINDVTGDDQSDLSRLSNAAELRRRLKLRGVKLLSEVRHGDLLTGNEVDWFTLACKQSPR